MVVTVQCSIILSYCLWSATKSVKYRLKKCINDLYEIEILYLSVSTFFVSLFLLHRFKFC